MKRVISFFREIFSHIKEQIEVLKAWVNALSRRVEIKGKAKFTFMIVPHSEKKSYSFSISYKKIYTIFMSAGILLLVTSLLLLTYSGRESNIHEMEISAEDYSVQSAKLKTELGFFHKMANLYYNKISSLYLRLGGDPAKVYLQKDEAEYPEIEPTTDLFPEMFRLQTDSYNMKLANELTREITKIIKDKNKIIQNTPSLWPVKGYILFPFGKYLSPYTGSIVNNYGIDIGTFPGSEVVATAPGLVYEIGYSDLTNHYIKITHKYGWKTIYSNLERPQVKKNQIVSKGDLLGYSTKGHSAPIYHLHYEVHVGTSPLNPFSFLNQIQN